MNGLASRLFTTTCISPRTPLRMFWRSTCVQRRFIAFDVARVALAVYGGFIELILDPASFSDSNPAAAHVLVAVAQVIDGATVLVYIVELATKTTMAFGHRIHHRISLVCYPSGCMSRPPCSTTRGFSGSWPASGSMRHWTTR